MTQDGFLQAVAAALETHGIPGPLGPPRPIAGGCIHDTAQVMAGDGRALFLKSGPPEAGTMLAAEARALERMHAADGPRVPAALGWGTAGGRAWLALEFIPLRPDGDRRALGRALAHMHAARGTSFGLDHDNFIGTTPQPNTPHDDWTAFWRDCRLGHQLALAADDGHDRLAERGQRLAEALDVLLGEHRPVPSLLHGDLWAGNHGFDHDGRGVLFDPASYYGDREADLAMTELFGGFGADFHAAYAEAWPLDPGYPVRRELYNLYHVLNHAHLFGGGYVRQSERMIDRLLAEAGE